MLRNRLNLIHGAIALIALVSSSVRVCAETEYEAKAKMLRFFAEKTTWREPDFESKSAPFVIAMLGDNKFGPREMAILEGTSTIAGHKVTVNVIDEADKNIKCHVLFIFGTPKRDLAALASTLKEKRVLAISESEEFLKVGGDAVLVMRQFGPTKGNVVPEINDRVTKSRNWEFNSDVYRLIDFYRKKFG